jgi:hypothetical protein
LRGAALVERLPVPHLHLAGELVVGGLRSQHREQGIEQRQVHHLARAAVHFDLAQRHHDRAVA